MRTHRLEDLTIPGRDAALKLLPDFDFYRLGRMIKLSLQTGDANREDYDLVLSALYDAGDQCCMVEIKFMNVRTIKLPEMAPSFFFNELEIEDLSKDQMEGIRYRARDYGATDFEVLCEGIEITNCQSIR